MLQCRVLGNTSIFVSPIGLGTVKFGRTEDVKYPHKFDLPTDKEARNLLSFAQTLGINVIDTAPAYGTSEERLGQLLHPSERKDWVIVTKVGEEYHAGKSDYLFTPEHTHFSIHRSLQRLNTDYLDVVLVHCDKNDVHNIQHFGILECLEDIKKKGIIRSFGVSTNTVEGGLLSVEKSDLIMVTYNPTHTESKKVIARAHELQKGVLVKKALASGHLDKFQHDSPLHFALDFVFKEPGISSVIIGTLNPLHLQEIVDTYQEIEAGY